MRDDTDLLLSTQVMAAARCRVPKALLLLRTLAGKRWSEADLFHAHLPRSPRRARRHLRLPLRQRRLRGAQWRRLAPPGTPNRWKRRRLERVCASTTSRFCALLLAPHTWLALCAPNPTAFN